MMGDVIHIYAPHILLGRPWQFDRRANHDSFKNRFNFMKEKEACNSYTTNTKTSVNSSSGVKARV